MGRPVILPHCNIGNDLTHGKNALLLEEGNALEIAARIEELLADRELADRLGAGSRQFAEEQLSWRSNAEGLANFLSEVLDGRHDGLGRMSVSRCRQALAGDCGALAAAAQARRQGRALRPLAGAAGRQCLGRGDRRQLALAGRRALRRLLPARADLLRHGARLRRQRRPDARACRGQLRHEGPAALLDGEGDPRQRRARFANPRDRRRRAARRRHPLAPRLRRDLGRPLRRQRQRAARVQTLPGRLPGPQLHPRAVPAERAARAGLRRDLLDLGARARAARSDRRA